MRNIAAAIIVLVISLGYFSKTGLHSQVTAQTSCNKVVAKDGSGDFTSIQAGINALSSGQTLCIKNGTYSEEVDINKQNVIVKNFTGHKPVIDGRYNRSLLNGSGNSLSLPSVISSPNFLPRNGSVLGYSPLVKITATGTTLEGMTVQNSAGRGIAIAANNTIVKNNRLYWIASEGIHADQSSSRGALANVQVLNNIVLFTSVISLNKEYRDARDSPDPATGIMKFGSFRGPLLVSGNYGAYGYGEGINIGKDNRGTSSQPLIIEKNIIHDTRHKMIYVNSGQQVHVRSNLAFSSNPMIRLGGRIAGGQIGIVDESTDKEENPNSQDVYFYNNVVVNGENWNFHMGRIHNRYTNLYVGFNTFVAGPNTTMANIHATKSIAMTGIIENNVFYGKSLSGEGNYSNIKFKNNLWYPESPEGTYLGEGSLLVDPKLFLPNSQIAPVKFPGEAQNTNLNFSDLEFLPNSFQSEIDVNKYLLNSDSPAINTASTRSAVGGFLPPQEAYTYDFFGNTRISPDIGAHEYSGILTTPYPSPTFTPTPSPSSQPSPSAPTSWDLNNDGKINGYDFVKLVKGIGSTYNLTQVKPFLTELFL